jgi:hypothetical protein
VRGKGPYEETKTTVRQVNEVKYSIMSRPQWQSLLRAQWISSLRTTRTASRVPLARVAFSTSARRELMEMTGFTEEQLTVKEAISHICSKFPNTYWQEHDQQEKDPKRISCSFG